MLSNTTILDIVIGLVFVYFVYSLLVTIIGEMLSSWMGMRARLLRQGLDNLLNDHRPNVVKTDLFKWLLDIFMIEPKEFRYTAAGQFYKESTIRNLAKRGENARYSIRNTKPSYISKEVYARTLSNMFSRKGRGVSELERVFMAVETNALHLEPETQKKFNEMRLASNGDYVLFTSNLEDDFSEMMDRVNGWYKRKLGFLLFWLGFLICLVLNVDTFQIIKILSSNPEKRQEMVKLAEQAVSNGVSSERFLNTVQDSLTYTDLLEDSYIRAVKDAQNAEFLLAKGWEFTPNIRSVRIAAKDTMLVKEILASGVALQKQIAACKSIIEAKEKGDTSVKADLVRFQTLSRRYNQAILGRLNDTLNKSEVRFLRGNVLHSIGSFTLGESGLLQVRYWPDGWDKIGFVLSQLLPWYGKFWGIVLSALALSLGASFWFDLLKRLVSLRSAGVKPEEKQADVAQKATSGKPGNDGKYTDVKDPIEKTLSIYRGLWENMRGVVAINRMVWNAAGKEVEGIEIVRDATYIEGSIPNAVIVDIEKNRSSISIRFKNGTACALNPGSTYDIEDKDFLENCIIHDYTQSWGTVTGWVKDRYGASVLLSCGHVLMSDASGYIKENKDVIHLWKNKAKVSLGKVSNLILSNYLDVGLIAVNSGAVKAWFSEIPRIRPLNDKDTVNKTKVTIRTLRGDKYGKVQFAKWDNKMDDKTQLFMMYNLILIKFDEGYETYPGDSGSLVMERDPVNGLALGIHIGSVTLDSRKYGLAIGLSEVLRVLNVDTVSL